jgi:hypothetical protein
VFEHVTYSVVAAVLEVSISEVFCDPFVGFFVISVNFLIPLPTICTLGVEAEVCRKNMTSFHLYILHI